MSSAPNSYTNWQARHMAQLETIKFGALSLTSHDWDDEWFQEQTHQRWKIESVRQRSDAREARNDQAEHTRWPLTPSCATGD